MLSPRALGTITHIAEKGSYAVNVRESRYDLSVLWNLMENSPFTLGRGFGNRIPGQGHKTHHDATLARSCS